MQANVLLCTCIWKQTIKSFIVEMQNYMLEKWSNLHSVISQEAIILIIQSIIPFPCLTSYPSLSVEIQLHSLPLSILITIRFSGF